MFNDYNLIISALTTLLSLTAAVSALSPRGLLPQNVPYLRRGTTNGTLLNNITSNTTSSSENFLWVIQDTFDASNFFE
jgi:hypothetical protein